MNRFTLAFPVLVAALALPAVAAAKGPDQASITGPGIDKITLQGNGDLTASPLGQLTIHGGLFPAAVGQIPDPMLESAPTKQLGPKYRIRYRVPWEQGKIFWLDQDAYPYAKGGALTYTKPGQRIFESRSPGGWYLGGTELRLVLQRAGLPARAPDASTGTNTALVAGIAVPGALALAAAGLLYRRRRHPA